MRQGLKASHTELCRFCIFGNGSANRGPRCYPRPGGGWGLVVGPSVSSLPPPPTPIATWAPTTRTKIDFLQQLCRCLYTGLASQLHGCSALSQRLGTTPMASSDSLEAEPHQYAKGCRHASTTARATVSENLIGFANGPYSANCGSWQGGPPTQNDETLPSMRSRFHVAVLSSRTPSRTKPPGAPWRSSWLPRRPCRARSMA